MGLGLVLWAEGTQAVQKIVVLKPEAGSPWMLSTLFATMFSRESLPVELLGVMGSGKD